MAELSLQAKPNSYSVNGRYFPNVENVSDFSVWSQGKGLGGYRPGYVQAEEGTKCPRDGWDCNCSYDNEMEATAARFAEFVAFVDAKYAALEDQNRSKTQAVVDENAQLTVREETESSDAESTDGGSGDSEEGEARRLGSECPAHWIPCLTCGSMQPYDGQCPCWVVELDSEEAARIDAAMVSEFARFTATGEMLIYPVFGAPGDPPEPEMPSEARLQVAWDGEERLTFPTEEERDALKAIRSSEDGDGEEVRAGYTFLVAAGHNVIDIGVMAYRRFDEDYQIAGTDEDGEIKVMNELRDRGVGLNLRELTLHLTGVKPEPVTAASFRETIKAFNEATVKSLQNGRPNSLFGFPKNPVTNLADDERANTRRGEERAEPGETAATTNPAAAPCPEEPYNNGWCWFAAISPAARETMWAEVDCAQHATLREINQLGRKYGFSRDRLIIKRISEGKYHMSPDRAGHSGDARNFEAWMDEIYSPNGVHSRAKTGTFGMPYRNYAGRMQAAAMGPWCEVGQFSTVVASAMARDFSKVTERRAVRDEFAKLDRAAPFGRNLHFPNHDAYIWLAGGDWPNKMMQLYSALAYQEASVEDNRAGAGGDRQGQPGRGGAGGGGQQGNSFGYNDAATAFYNALRNMQNQISNVQGIYDRQSIENEFNAPWTALSVADVVELAADVLKATDVLIHHTEPGRWTWSGTHADYVGGDEVGAVNVPRNGNVVLWSFNRVAAHRARTVLQTDRHGGIMSVSHTVEPTNN